MFRDRTKFTWVGVAGVPGCPRGVPGCPGTTFHASCCFYDCTYFKRIRWGGPGGGGGRRRRRRMEEGGRRWEVHPKTVKRSLPISAACRRPPWQNLTPPNHSHFEFADAKIQCVPSGFSNFFIFVSNINIIACQARYRSCRSVSIPENHCVPSAVSIRRQKYRSPRNTVKM